MDVRTDWKPQRPEPDPPKRLKRTNGFRRNPDLAREFRFAVLHETGGRCLMADHSPCDGVLDPAHLIPKAWLRNHGFSELVAYDARNGTAACRRHHRRSDSGLERFPRELLPPAVHEFAAEHGLTYLVDRLYPERTR